MPSDPTRAYGPMGNYLFDIEVLLRALHEAKQRAEHDFGRDILPRLIETHDVHAYDFAQNRVPGIRDYEELGYWRDVGTIDAYFAANQAVRTCGRRALICPPPGGWCVPATTKGPTLRVFKGQIENSTIGAGSIVKGGRVPDTTARGGDRRGRRAGRLHRHGQYGHRPRRKAAPRDQWTVTTTSSSGTRIGYDVAADRGRYHVTESGLVVAERQAPEAGATHHQER